MSEDERERDQPAVLPGREAMKLLGEEPAESETDEPAERSEDADRDRDRER